MKIVTILGFLLIGFTAQSQKSVVQVKEEVIEYKKIDTISLKLHLYKPLDFDASKTYNAMVFFHGGGWNGGSYKAFKRQSMYLASRGMIAISVEYRVKKVHGTSPFVAVEDAKSAIRYVREHAKDLNINPTMIASGGGSAGGHLAAACGNIVGLDLKTENLKISSKPNSLVLFNPVYDNSKNGYGYKAIEGRVDEISPLHNISKGAPPTIVFFGTNDKTTPVSSSREYDKKMKAIGSRNELCLYEGAAHSFFNKGAYFVDTVDKMDDFLVSLKYLNGASTVKEQYAFMLGK
ncbi:MAG: peptidase S9 [Flavobacteriaceae bacterium]|nr:MAG: peptidase S9 [Flavobacteriaceae bacterium]